MRLTETSLVIRPRSYWEALDLGILLAGRYRRLLVLSWIGMTLPVFIILTAVLWRYPTAVMLVLWWLKPAFDRLPLFILSQALFEDPPTLGQALRRWPALLRPQLLASLTWRRLSLSRSYGLPVQQLEKLDGGARQKRLTLLRKNNGGAARWLTIVGMHLELALWTGMMALLYLLLPDSLPSPWDSDITEVTGHFEGSWPEHLSNVFYWLVIAIWEPIYVSCGFTLYLNRRTVLEAWDIELVLRQLRQRLGAIAALLLVAGMLVLPVPSAFAAAAPDTPRLLNQTVSSQAAHQTILRIVGEPPFRNPETVTRWSFGQAPDAAVPSARPPLLPGLNVGWLATLIELCLWSLLAGTTSLLIWRHGEWLRTFVQRLRPPAKSRHTPPPQLFGLMLKPQSLPGDVASAVEHLWPEQPREALGLLYRALLSRVLNEYQLRVKAADTEAQVLAEIARLGLPELTQFSTHLTQHWQNLAYGHRPPPLEAQVSLCQQWRRLFDSQVQP